MGDAFTAAINDLDEAAFQLWYGRWDPLEPGQVAELFFGTSIRWWIAGGRAARVGAAERHHEDVDVAVSLEDLGQVREQLAGWHVWEAHNGSLRPLLPGDTLSEGCEQLWVRRNAEQPWQLDLLLDHSQDEWVFKRDPQVRVPWDRALHSVDGVAHLKPEIALLHKAHLDRPKDRDDLAAAHLDPHAQRWLAATLDRLGHDTWARIVRLRPQLEDEVPPVARN